MSDLPTGWVNVPIGSFARIVGGGTPPSKDPANFAKPGEGIPWITPADLSGYRSQTIKSGSRDLTPDGLAACGATLMPAGSVLFSSRAPIGYVAIAANEIATNQGFKSFVLPGGFDPRFTYYQLKHLKPEAEAIATGTTFKELSGAAASKLSFRVAPEREQVIIADKLDALTTQINACTNRLETIPILLKRFRQAVLDAAMSGSFTGVASSSTQQKQNKDSVLAARLRAEKGTAKKKVQEFLLKHPPQVSSRDLPDGWIRTHVGVIGIVTNGSTPSRGIQEYWNGKIPWVSSGEVANNEISRTRESITEAGFDNSSVRLLPVGSVLLAMIGEGKTRGQSSLLNIPACINQNVAGVIPVRELIEPKFLWYWFQRQYEATRTVGNGSGPKALNCERVRELEVFLPPINEQMEIVLRIEALFKFADSIEARHTAAVRQAQRLTALTLAKAFRGELVQQNPQDEPASILLQRIAGKQPAEVKAARGRPRVKKPETVEVSPVSLPDWSTLPAGAWAAQVPADEHTATAQLTAVLKAWNKPMPQDTARLATLLCLQPRLLTAALPAYHAAQWRRLVGDAAAPLPAQVVTLQPAFNTPWRNAISKMRARGDLVETGSGSQGTWALGPDAARVNTAGWPDGRAGWVVHYLQTHGVEAVLPTLATEVQEFVHARAA